MGRVAGGLVACGEGGCRWSTPVADSCTVCVQMAGMVFQHFVRGLSSKAPKKGKQHACLPLRIHVSRAVGLFNFEGLIVIGSQVSRSSIPKGSLNERKGTRKKVCTQMAFPCSAAGVWCSKSTGSWHEAVVCAEWCLISGHSRRILKCSNLEQCHADVSLSCSCNWHVVVKTVILFFECLEQLAQKMCFCMVPIL